LDNGKIVQFNGDYLRPERLDNSNNESIVDMLSSSKDINEVVDNILFGRKNG
jgi:hypothetical protein